MDEESREALRQWLDQKPADRVKRYLERREQELRAGLQTTALASTDPAVSRVAAQLAQVQQVRKLFGGDLESIEGNEKKYEDFNG